VSAPEATFVITATPTPLLPPGSGAYQPVVVALRDIPANSPISAGAVTVVLWPVETAPTTAITTTERIANLVATTDIAKWQPVLTTRVAFDVELSPDKVAITVPQDGSNLGLLVGDRVDVIATTLFIDVAGTYQSAESDAGAPDTTTPQPQLDTQRIIQNAEVITIGTLFPGEFDDVITLAMSPDDATIMRWLVDEGIPFTLVQVETE
jgi:Flp pilus assembly protein CpaB